MEVVMETAGKENSEENLPNTKPEVSGNWLLIWTSLVNVLLRSRVRAGNTEKLKNFNFIHSFHSVFDTVVGFGWQVMVFVWFSNSNE